MTTPASDIIRSLNARLPLSNADLNTPHIYKNGARENLVDLGAALTVTRSFVSLSLLLFLSNAFLESVHW